jgi:hypothetical protein
LDWNGFGRKEAHRCERRALDRIGKRQRWSTASVEALQYNQSGDAYPDHAAEAEGQPVREVVEGKRRVGLGDHFVHDEVSC